MRSVRDGSPFGAEELWVSEGETMFVYCTKTMMILNFIFTHPVPHLLNQLFDVTRQRVRQIGSVERHRRSVGLEDCK